MWSHLAGYSEIQCGAILPNLNHMLVGTRWAIDLHEEDMFDNDHYMGVIPMRL